MSGSRDTKRMAAGVLAAGLASAGSPAIAATPTTTETIIFIRHAEKPAAGLGQLSCMGLNRSLALPAALARKFGRIDAVFAPDPSNAKQDGTGRYDYVRPLATVEPTAIRFGLPVHAGLGFSDGEKLLAALQEPPYRAAHVLVAWEHHAMQTLVPALLRSRGASDHTVPEWKGGDFDSIWIVTLTWTLDGRATAAFVADHEGLDGQPDSCPL